MIHFALERRSCIRSVVLLERRCWRVDTCMYLDIALRFISFEHMRRIIFEFWRTPDITLYSLGKTTSSLKQASIFPFPSGKTWSDLTVVLHDFRSMRVDITVCFQRVVRTLSTIRRMEITVRSRRLWIFSKTILPRRFSCFFPRVVRIHRMFSLSLSLYLSVCLFTYTHVHITSHIHTYTQVRCTERFSRSNHNRAGSWECKATTTKSSQETKISFEQDRNSSLS